MLFSCCKGCLHQNNIFIFGVCLFPLLFPQLNSQCSVCDITIGRSSKADFSLQVDSVPQEQMSSVIPQSVFECACYWSWGEK